MTVVADEPIHVVATTAEVKVVRVTGITLIRITLLVRRGTPVVTERSTTAKRSTKPTSSRKENTVAIGAGYLITINAFIGGPVPSATFYKFFKFFLCRQTPTATPLSASYIIGGVSLYTAN